MKQTDENMKIVSSWKNTVIFKKICTKVYIFNVLIKQ